MSWALQEYKVQVKPTPRLFSIYMGKPVIQFTVWVNGKQNSEKVNFLRNSVYHLHKPVPFMGKRLRKPETGMVSNMTFSDILLLLEIFHWNDPKSRVQLTFRPNFPETFWYLCELVVVNIRFISSF